MMNIGVAEMMVGLVETGRIAPCDACASDDGPARQTRLRHFAGSFFRVCKAVQRNPLSLTPANVI